MDTSISLETIKTVLPGLDVVQLMEKGFVAYSEGRAVVPPVGELIFEDPPGETHIKYGYIRGGDHFVIKVASGFYGNPALGLSSGQGVMLLFSQKTGAFEAALLDEGHLTDVRTAAAGAVAAKQLAPSDVECIGILGGGTQARLQLEMLGPYTSCRKVVCWTYDGAEIDPYLEYFAASDFQIEFVDSPEENMSALRGIKEMGVEISIGHFGTGHSSLGYLRNFPVDQIKIDQSFVKGIPANTDNAAIVASFIPMTHSLGMTVVADGVENAEQLSFLKDRGCDEYQGQRLSSPVPGPEFLSRILDQ